MIVSKKILWLLGLLPIIYLFLDNIMEFLTFILVAFSPAWVFLLLFGYALYKVQEASTH